MRVHRYDLCILDATENADELRTETAGSVKAGESLEQPRVRCLASGDQLLHREVTARVSYWESWLQISLYPEEFRFTRFSSGKCRTVI